MKKEQMNMALNGLVEGGLVTFVGYQATMLGDYVWGLCQGTM